MSILQAIGGTIIVLGMYGLIGTLEFDSRVEYQKSQIELGEIK
jgi:hypothetical protein